ncbi:3-phenylpropionate/trans-cinnamate dioxygenase ferredoxin subunit [Trueperella bonasi]|uniref:3-phenylpropionate/trans-cinnamate dioxygenase ferredoxin subunit n=1 Tax=Trueperella bonasi TaxID=312286 RepID=A0ABT9NET6_9ACTO|nr:non-heme iron oxygenase ferredoxin subunit [Trueperella bonasi]MDP9805558.1 3-phenylpropionate/trans-cinnamate dioxygenase ferredoxin subunit [Trueperella bonasi]
MPEYLACQTSDVEPGTVQATAIEIPGKPLPLALAVIHSDSGNWFAVDDRCSHGRFKLSQGDVDGDTIECTRHGSSFDLHSGESMNPPASAPIKTYPVRVDGEHVYITVE